MQNAHEIFGDQVTGKVQRHRREDDDVAGPNLVLGGAQAQEHLLEPVGHDAVISDVRARAEHPGDHAQRGLVVFDAMTERERVAKEMQRLARAGIGGMALRPLASMM